MNKAALVIILGLVLIAWSYLPTDPPSTKRIEHQAQPRPVSDQAQQLPPLGYLPVIMFYHNNQFEQLGVLGGLLPTMDQCVDTVKMKLADLMADLGDHDSLRGACIPIIQPGAPGTAT